MHDRRLSVSDVLIDPLRRGDMQVVPKLVGALADSELRVRMAATDALREVAPKLCWRRKRTQRPTGHLWTSMDMYGHLWKSK